MFEIIVARPRFSLNIILFQNNPTPSRYLSVFRFRSTALNGRTYSKLENDTKWQRYLVPRGTVGDNETTEKSELHVVRLTWRTNDQPPPPPRQTTLARPLSELHPRIPDAAVTPGYDSSSETSKTWRLYSLE